MSTLKLHTAILLLAGALIAGSQLLAGGCKKKDKHLYIPPGADSWEILYLDNSFVMTYLTSIWTGEEIIVFGAGENLTDNHCYAFNPESRTWRKLSHDNIPSPRWCHSAVWTGEEMIVWGGYDIYGTDNELNTGGIYNLASDTWRPTTTVNAPYTRIDHGAVWTGEEMIIWSGYDEEIDNSSTDMEAGAIYNPVTDSWRSMTDMTQACNDYYNSTYYFFPSGISHGGDQIREWAGDRFIILRGTVFLPGASVAPTEHGGVYNPETDSWILIPPATYEYAWISGVWTGTDFIAASINRDSDNSDYNIIKFASLNADNSWTKLYESSRFSGGADGTITATCSCFAGGYFYCFGLSNDNGQFSFLYDTEKNESVILKQTPRSPSYIYSSSNAIWTGDRIIVVGLTPINNIGIWSYTLPK